MVSGAGTPGMEAGRYVGRFPGPQAAPSQGLPPAERRTGPGGPPPGQILPEHRQGSGTGGPEARQGGRGLGAAAIASLLTAPQKKRWQGQSPADVQRPCPLGAVDLMGGDGDAVRPQGLGLEGQLQKALDGVGVKNRVGSQAVG